MLRSTLSSWREYLTPVSHKSTFIDSGEITPEEFVKAGDYLCHMFPMWSWNEVSSNVSCRKFLPEDRQFLVIRKVRCDQRAEQFVELNDDYKSMGLIGDGEAEGAEEDGWVIGQQPQEQEKADSKTAESSNIEDMIQDMVIEDDLDNELVQDGENKANGTRFYDLYITYSTSYKVPKFYLVGFSSSGTPLTPTEMFQDISADYRAKTATIEKLPFYKNSIPSVSIHPCKHANVMKILLDKVRSVKQRKRQEDEGGTSNADEWEDVQGDIDDLLPVNRYLIVFLKFMTSVTPGIEHDYTMEGW